MADDNREDQDRRDKVVVTERPGNTGWIIGLIVLLIILLVIFVWNPFAGPTPDNGNGIDVEVQPPPTTQPQ